MRVTGGETEILMILRPRPCTPCTHSHTQEGVAVAFCVVRLLRNRSKTKFFQQPGRFQARTRFLVSSRARPGRASRKPPGTRVTPAQKGSRYMAQMAPSAPNHMEPLSAAPRPGLRDAAIHVWVCSINYNVWVGVSVPRSEWDRLPDIIASAWSHLIPRTRTKNTGVGQS